MTTIFPRGARGLAWLPLVALGCVSGSTLAYTPVRPPPRGDRCEVTVLPPGGVPEGPVRAIGFVQAQGGTLTGDARLMEELINRACALGGDGIMDLRRGTTSIALPSATGMQTIASPMWSATVFVRAISATAEPASAPPERRESAPSAIEPLAVEPARRRRHHHRPRSSRAREHTHHTT